MIGGTRRGVVLAATDSRPHGKAYNRKCHPGANRLSGHLAHGFARIVHEMPTNLTEITVASLKTFTEEVETRMQAAERLWYRGCGARSYALTPGLFRHPTRAGIEDLLTLEKSLLTSFRHRSLPYLANQPTTDFEWLFLMQHQAVPTRLLDWTENPYVALFFALSSAPIVSRTADGTPEYKEDCSVWLLDPAIWNRRSLNRVTFSEGILSAGDELLKGYAPGTDPRIMNTDPIALYGVHNSRRIVAQRGVFVVFGKDLHPMEHIFSAGDYPEPALTKLNIPAAKVADLLKALTSIGVTDSAIYPDLDGLAKEIKRAAGFYI